MLRKYTKEKLAEKQRKDLIKTGPACGYACLNKDFGRKPYSCGCHQCAANKGYFEDGEVKETEVERRKILTENWDEEKGYLREDGCILPRWVRSDLCLSYDCTKEKRGVVAR